MNNIIKKLYQNDAIRYVFFGGCTTLVNLISFYFLRKMNISLNVANFISIVIAILFAYFVNSKYVFQNKTTGIKNKLIQFEKFIAARISTMIIEVVGVWLLVDVIQLKDMLGKFIIQFVVLILNYIFSKFFVFKK